MKIYIAGAWVEQHQRARPMIAAVRAAGLEVTCDWTVAEGDICACGKHRQQHVPFGDGGCEAFNGIGSGGDNQLTAEQRRKYALADLKGVLDADIVWLLAANDKGACGSWVELGAALAIGQVRSNIYGRSPIDPITIVSGLKWQRTIFTELAHRTFESDGEALKFVIELHKVDGSLKLTAEFNAPIFSGSR